MPLDARSLARRGDTETTAVRALGEVALRVKPPPAEIGEIISPSSASFEMAMPLNGALITMSLSWI